MDDEYIYLDYEAEFYPYCYISQNGALTGVYVELWKLIAAQQKRKIRWTMMRDNGTSTDAEMDPVERRIYDGAALTQVDTSFFAYEDSKNFKPSVPFSYTKAMLYEQQQGQNQEETEVVFFTVFSWDVIGFIIVALITISLLSSLSDRRKREDFDVFNLLFGCSTVLFTVGVTVVGFYYAAGFQGNSIVVVPPLPPSFEKSVLAMRSGRRKLVMQTDSEFYESQLLFFTGNQSMIEVSEVSDVLYMLCQDSSLIAPLYDSQLLAMNLVNDSCTLTGIDKELVLGQRLPYDQFYGVDSAAYYLFAKNTTAKTINVVNQVILRLFQQDQIDNFWTFRFMESIRQLDFSPPVTEIDYSPFNLSRLSLIFYVFLASIPLLIGSLLAELIVYRIKRSK